MTDIINAPAHYRQHPSGVESIRVAELGGFTLGNAIKYLFRWPYKGQAVSDLKKARYYIEHFTDTQAEELTTPHVKERHRRLILIHQVLTHEKPTTPLRHVLNALHYIIENTATGKWNLELQLAVHAINEQLKELENNG